MHKGKWCYNACDDKCYNCQDIVHHMLMNPSDDHLNFVSYCIINIVEYNDNFKY